MRVHGVRTTRPSNGSATMRNPADARTTNAPGVLELRGEEPVLGERLLTVAEDDVDELLREVGLL